ncbi:hypothetical protein H5410_037746 [Solanum commersonii]|uniref:Uncharacterized protein n=1 Tax=Solanum commersonii TaxID=4109 RepID=A0A9J5Y8U7_SOLCO|nr:hypothetical protein H5410_037746 [Solanum commersonii]
MDDAGTSFMELKKRDNEEAQSNCPKNSGQNTRAAGKTAEESKCSVYRKSHTSLPVESTKNTHDGDFDVCGFSQLKYIKLLNQYQQDST